MSGAGPDGLSPVRDRRRTGRVVSAAAALLLIGGGAAVAVALHAQVGDPPAAVSSGRLDRPGSTPAVAPTGSSPSSTAGPTAPDPALRPVRIALPSIGVTSRLIRVGQHRDGTLEVPQPGPNYDKAAWFTGSPQPGQVGPAVIEGHVDGTENGPSVFYRLGSVRPGDRVLVTRADGHRVRFTVYAVRRFPKDSFPTLTVYGNTNGPELRLITCGGRFDPGRRAGGYTDNVVVFARQT